MARREVLRKQYEARGARPSESALACSSDQSPFGMIGAKIYDADCLRVGRRYIQARMIQNEFVCQALERSAVPPILVDLGVGTGNDALEVLQRDHTVLYAGIDSSVPMLREAAAKLQAKGLVDRCRLFCYDFFDLSAASFRASLAKAGFVGGVKVVLSALSLHHAELADKAKAYLMAFRLLDTTGRLIVTDLFSNDLPDCALYALSVELDDLPAQKKDQMVVGPSSPTTLSEDHYTRANRPQPLLSELVAIRKAGFGATDILYREGQLAVIVAEKGSGGTL